MTTPRRTSRAIAGGRCRRSLEMPDRVTGAALFADISGFTPLTEALATELGPQRGAEELTANIGRVFHAVIDELDRLRRRRHLLRGRRDHVLDRRRRRHPRVRGGRRACRRRSSAPGTIMTPGGSTRSSSAMKVAIAVGDARRFVVGDPDIQLIDVLAGRLIDDLAEAEHYAEKGEIVLDPSAIAAPRRPRRRSAEVRRDEATGRDYGVLDAARSSRSPRAPVVEPPPLPEELVRPWLLPAVYERLRTGRGEFLAELRPAIPVFLRFGGHRLRRRRRRDREARRIRPRRAADHDRLRRQRPPADAGRQGRLPLRRVRVAASPTRTTRRGPRRPRSSCATSRRRRPLATSRSGIDPRPPAQRHVRPRDAPHLRLPRRRGEPRRPG